ncbi:MAG: hypothetical protein APG11_01580 [Candidatus Methanofastidiosum methylothiophilum]|uniref:Uncharacterized protein n=1 Tax=Candidatus Methanofastidiosum methylothiophilum TaxID=1705564 RepID=A0A150IPX0_9EURY|nr:MAG: hypothetical protein APG11_01580 [Candidatus Methanofastidiosum methylthiophilus]
MLNKKRILIGLVTGAILGIFCIIGVGSRIGYDNYIFLIAMWYNRIVMGLLIGLAGDLVITKSSSNVFIRGFLLGLIVSSAIFLSTEFKDLPSFFAGIVYGVIIDFVATKYEKKYIN